MVKLSYDEQKQPLEFFYKKSILKNFAIFTEEHQRWSLFQIKLQTLGLSTLLKIDSNTGIFLWTLQNF